MFRRTFLLFLILSSWVASAHAKSYRFADYPSDKIYSGKYHALQMPNDKLLAALSENIAAFYTSPELNKIGFAGFYVVAAWSCGLGCSNGALVDVRTGKSYLITPFRIKRPLMLCYLKNGKQDGDTFQYRANSRLFIANNCHFSEIKGNRMLIRQHKTEYIYEWIENKKAFHLIKEIERTGLVPRIKY